MTEETVDKIMGIIVSCSEGITQSMFYSTQYADKVDLSEVKDELMRLKINGKE
jgi:hypothetical protein